MADFWCILELPLAERIIRKYLIPRAMPMMNFELFSANACDCELYNYEQELIVIITSVPFSKASQSFS